MAYNQNQIDRTRKAYRQVLADPRSSTRLFVDRLLDLAPHLNETLGRDERMLGAVLRAACADGLDAGETVGETRRTIKRLMRRLAWFGIEPRDQDAVFAAWTDMLHDIATDRSVPHLPSPAVIVRTPANGANKVVTQNHGSNSGYAVRFGFVMPLEQDRAA